MPLRPLAECLIALLFFAAPIAASEIDARLVEAAKHGNEAAVGSLLEQGADTNVASGDGTMALHWAAHLDELGMAERLVRAGANVNALNRYGVTPLMLSCTRTGQILHSTRRCADAWRPLQPRFQQQPRRGFQNAARSPCQISTLTHIPQHVRPISDQPPHQFRLHAPHSRDAALRPRDFSHWRCNEKSLVCFQCGSNPLKDHHLRHDRLKYVS